MRLLIDSLIALMLVGILAGILVYHQHEAQELKRYRQVHEALAHLHEQALYHGALGAVDTSPTGFPLTISPLWFEGHVPLNVSVPGRQPWLDIAPVGDNNDHPPDPVCERADQAGFWYNPNRGIFRARVTPEISQTATLEKYNRVNGSFLKALPVAVDIARLPTPVRFIAAVKAQAGPADASVQATQPSLAPQPARPLTLTSPER